MCLEPQPDRRRCCPQMLSRMGEGPNHMTVASQRKHRIFELHRKQMEVAADLNKHHGWRETGSALIVGAHPASVR